MKLVVTGATGFLGGWVVRQALARGDEVLALGRNLQRGQELEQWGARFLPVDLTDRAGLGRAFKGQEGVIHAGALSSPWARAKEFELANVQGTRNVLNAALENGVRRRVFVSSASVYAAFRDQVDLRETDPLPSPINAYASSKQASERWVNLLCKDAAVVLRPRAIFGPGDTVLLPRLARVAQRGTLPLFRQGQALIDVSYVEDVARACLLGLEGRPGTYNLTQGTPLTVKALFETIVRLQGWSVQFKALPVGPTLLAARALEAAHRWFRPDQEPMLTAYGVGALSYSQTLNVEAAKAGLGWTPQWDLKQALAHTFGRTP